MIYKAPKSQKESGRIKCWRPRLYRTTNDTK